MATETSVARGGAQAGTFRLRDLPCLALTVLRRLVDIVAACLFIYMAFAILVQILGRYVFNYSIAGTEETATFAQVWLVMLGAGIAMRHHQHVGVDVLIVRCPVWIQKLVGGISFLLGLWFLVVVVNGSFGLVAIGMMVKSAALRLPLVIPYSAIPVGMTYFALEFTIATLPGLLGRKKSAAEAEHGELL
ncbi:TRAP transporter small permease [Martelella radicis]|uniref:TRAP transporter small permease protein n=1 Tax=Martelella radicis TaxID=1397476 RepID=A0A7W6KNW3_9HYPH|nr:TRAP transporter small permease [Martelella radicis]MBB4123263.1 TRAP-type C4-dicarboxylate transport system permease small subunit [Martelella radicis]